MTTVEQEQFEGQDQGSDYESEEDLETMVRTKGGDYTYQLQKACQKGDFDHIKKCLQKGVFIQIQGNKFVEDKKKWTPLVWTACKGYLDITRYLIQVGAAEPYINNQDQPRHVVQGTINSSLKPTPLQWACFKGHLKIVNLLLKNNMKWDDIDQFGNDCVHLAAASGNFQVFQNLIAYGVSVDRLNTRQHSCSDLSTDTQITNLINLHKNTKFCHISKQVPKVKHWCQTCKNFVGENCVHINWAYEDKDSLEAEKLDIRCDNCYAVQEKYETELKNVIKNYEYEPICQKIQEIEDIELVIDLKLKDHAIIVQERLRNQLQIQNYISQLKVIDDYKTILKAVKVLQDLKEKAQNNGVQLDDDILDLIAQQQGRLVAERNLRYELDNIETNNATQEQVDRLCELMEASKENGVAQNYIDDAEVLRSKMFKGIQSATLFKLFSEYPVRWIPEPIMYDPKTKKPIDPVTKKPIDPKNLPKPPKPKKGDPKFIIPLWAETTDKHQEAIRQFEELLTQAAELNLTDDFVNESKKKIAHLKNDLRYRYQLEKEAKELAEQKAAEKAKNKKK